MKHQDSIKQAHNFLNLAIEQLELWGLAATPINYSVSYDFVSESNKALSTAIKFQLSTDKKLDNFYMETIYQKFILGQGKFRDEMLTDFSTLLSRVEETTVESTSSVSDFVSSLNTNINSLKPNNEELFLTACNNIAKASLALKTEQELLTEKLREYQLQSKSLQSELEEVRQEMYLDPLTGFHNRQAMSKHIEAWFNEDPNKAVTTIVINIDQYDEITEQFGSLISDVLLAKIASKIESYIGDNSLPIRTGGDEFLILLPEIDTRIASVIGERIRQGVGKLKFISSKSGVRLPEMKISIGVNQFRVSQNVNTVIDKTRRAI